jgi:hypothetical protein
MATSLWIVLKMKSVSDEICSENRKAHFMFKGLFETMWKNMVKVNRPQITI